MMNIPIHDQNPLEGEIVDGVMGADSHVIEEAEPHGPIPFRMMSWGPHQGKPVVQFARPRGLDQLTKAPGGKEGGLTGFGRSGGIHIEPEVGLAGCGCDPIDIDRENGLSRALPGWQDVASR